MVCCWRLWIVSFGVFLFVSARRNVENLSGEGERGAEQEDDKEHGAEQEDDKEHEQDHINPSRRNGRTAPKGIPRAERLSDNDGEDGDD